VTVLFVNERESDEIIDKAFTSKVLISTFLDVKKNISSFSAHMSKKGFATRPLILQPAATLYSWATGLPWEKVLSIAKMEEGDLAMLILRTADNLRHIRTLKNVFPEAASAAATAIDLIMRYPVVMDYE